jgi:hypothetical protein
MNELEGPISAEAVVATEIYLSLCEIAAAGLYVLAVYRLTIWAIN